MAIASQSTGAEGIHAALRGVLSEAWERIRR
jgi:hypothetical protein